MTPSTATVSATFFFITDTRSTDRIEAQPTQATTSSNDQRWKYAVSSHKAS